MELSQLETLVHLSEQRARSQPDGIAYTFLADEHADPANLTFAELWERSGWIANHLLQQGLGSQRVQLIYPPGLDFILAFLACLRAGILAAPVSPPASRRQSTRMFKIAADFQADTVLTNSAYLEYLRQPQVSDKPRLSYLVTDRAASPDMAESAQWPSLQGHRPAFVQYTSGSTGNPKGVVVTHRNIMHNQRLIQQAFGHDRDTIFAGWLPLFHDMGLIGNVLHPLFLGVRSVLMSPMRFLTQPASWLKMISDYRATTSGGPNFGYEYCVAKVDPETIAGLDLSSWRVAFNGSEPVQASTLRKFSEKFRPFGFAPRAFYPCYGLAEATLFVSGPESMTAPVKLELDRAHLSLGQVRPADMSASAAPKTVTLVSSGRAWLNDDIRIVDPHSCRECQPDRVGEIWLASDSVAAGYWNDTGLSEKVFAARLNADSQCYLRTGDLGFINARQELFVTGRLSDLIIVRGRNYYPQDLEVTAAASHAELGPTAAAVMHERDGQRVYLFQELRADLLPDQLALDVHNEIKRCINERIWYEHELRVHEIRLLPARSIPKTSSGKVRRRACLERLLSEQGQPESPV